MTLIEATLEACGGGLEDLTNVNVFLKNNDSARYHSMNRAYVEYFKGKPLPARITVGCGSLALGANVEVQATAYCCPK
eukprot:CAMPEP_0114491700 /NCGR_PEP_ID=MMETSP0109-20121206/3151_1 /TAXON_ID=29199 /ORGANISM="Chlorarachnion reptans, Strain CCCM449" /LENGTH=77 /DNA_ID=CAMNT_0001668473 /DNA_START=411 /DNA_END=644 /DNA_ORIENTATION=+